MLWGRPVLLANEYRAYRGWDYKLITERPSRLKVTFPSMCCVYCRCNKDVQKNTEGRSEGRLTCALP